MSLRTMHYTNLCIGNVKQTSKNYALKIVQKEMRNIWNIHFKFSWFQKLKSLKRYEK